MIYTKMKIILYICAIILFLTSNNISGNFHKSISNADCTPLTGNKFTWIGVPNVLVLYDVKIDDNSDFSSPEIERKGLVVNYFHQDANMGDLDPLYPSTIYHMKITTKLLSGIVIDVGISQFLTCKY